MKYNIIITILIIGIIAALLSLGTVLSNTLIHNANDLTTEEIYCAKTEMKMLLNHPIDYFFVTKIVVAEKKGNLFYVDAYTIGGIKYVSYELECGEGSRLLWSLFFWYL